MSSCYIASLETDPDGYITSQTFTDPLGNVVREKADGMYTDRTFDRSGNTIASYVYGESSAGEGGILTLSLHNENGNQTHTAPSHMIPKAAMLW